MAAPPRFSPGLVSEMRAQGLSEEDAVAALETCDGDGEKVRFHHHYEISFLRIPRIPIFSPLVNSPNSALQGSRLSKMFSAASAHL